MVNFFENPQATGVTQGLNLNLRQFQQRTYLQVTTKKEKNEYFKTHLPSLPLFQHQSFYNKPLQVHIPCCYKLYTLPCN